MRVFLSWSGLLSKKMAEAFGDWLPSVLNGATPFMSTHIDAGSRWRNALANELEITDFGVAFITLENQRSPWLNFEVGALAKAVSSSRVVPLAVDLTPAEVEDPLAQFQAVPLNYDGISKVIMSINQAMETPLDSALITRTLAMCWPHLDRAASAALEDSQMSPAKPPPRSDRDLLEDILNTVRALNQRSPNLADNPDPTIDFPTGRWPSTAERALLENLRTPEVMKGKGGLIALTNAMKWMMQEQLRTVLDPPPKRPDSDEDPEPPDPAPIGVR